MICEARGLPTFGQFTDHFAYGLFLTGNSGGAGGAGFVGNSKVNTNALATSIAGGTTADGIVFKDATIFYSDSGLAGGAAYTPTERMRITNAGLVGIGTASPTRQLHVLGTGVFERVDNDAVLTLRNNQTAPSAGRIAELSAQNKDSGGSYEDFAGLRFYSTDVTNGTEAGAIGFNTMNGATYNEQMRITGAGWVGIGTSTPDNKFVVDGTGTDNRILVGANTGAARTQLFANSAYLGGMGSVGTYSNHKFVLRTNDLDRMTLDTSGNVGIGTTSPVVPLEVIGTSASHWIRSGSTGASSVVGFLAQNPNKQYSLAARGDMSDAFSLADETAGAHRIVVLSGGNVGIGTTSPPTKLSVGTDTDSADTIPALGATGGRFSVTNANAYGLIAGVLSSGNIFQQVQRIDGIATAYSLLLQPSGGNVGIGTTTPGYKLDVQGGDVNTSGAYTNVSDVRLKQDIYPLEKSLDKILRLRSVSYYWKDQSVDSTKQIGFIAQEVENVFPEVVKTDRKGFKAMSYSQLVSPVVDALKEFYKKWFEDSQVIHGDLMIKEREIASLKIDAIAKNQRIYILEKENADIKARLERIEKVLISR